MSEVAVLTLSEFLLERIAEDEAVVEWAMGRTPPAVYEGWKAWNGPGHVPMIRAERFAAQCAAHRAIVELHNPHPRDPDSCVTCSAYESTDITGPPFPCPTLRALAAVYADHPDYRDEWKP